MGDIPISGGTIYYDYSYEAIRFRQQYLVKFFVFSDLDKSVADADLKVSIDFSNSGDYSKLTKQIMKTLRVL
jgi:hypothetical protein